MRPRRAMPGHAAALVGAILDPSRLRRLSPRDWEWMLSTARRNAVLAYLAQRVERFGLIDELPPAPRAALLAARTATVRLAQLARWEIDRVRRTLAPHGIPIIALKGVAYLLRGMAHADTRILSDVDVMVPRERIDAAERTLLAAGWQGTKLDPYDQRYYRKWSHEIPPLLFPGRLLGVDVHHTICPPVSRLRPDPLQFWEAAEATSEPGVRVLAPVDSVLHAAVHLFFDSDFDGRFRDLIDLHELLQAFGVDARFWPALTERARMQGLGRPLHYAFETLAEVLSTPIPAEARREAARFAPPPIVDGWMTRTLATVLTPADPARWPPAHRGRLWLLYVRSHWLRMPPHVLVPHLIVKATRKPRPAIPMQSAEA